MLVMKHREGRGVPVLASSCGSERDAPPELWVGEAPSPTPGGGGDGKCPVALARTIASPWDCFLRMLLSLLQPQWNLVQSLPSSLHSCFYEVLDPALSCSWAKRLLSWVSSQMRGWPSPGVLVSSVVPQAPCSGRCLKPRGIRPVREAGILTGCRRRAEWPHNAPLPRLSAQQPHWASSGHRLEMIRHSFY